MTTWTHPFYVDGKGWTDAGELTEQDNVLAYGERKLRVEGIWIEELSEPVKVYNFEVEEYHTYYVGEAEVLVHNDNCGQGKGNEGGSKTNIDDAINNGQPLSNHRIVSDTDAPSLPATKQTRNSSADLLNLDGSVKQRRYYGEDGKAQMDIDFNHTDDGTHEFPHIHKWDWSKKPPRQDSRKR